MKITCHSKFLTEYNEEKERKLAREEAALIAHEEGREEGINENQHRVAENMLRENLPLNLIEKITLLSEDVIREIAKSIGVQTV